MMVDADIYAQGNGGFDIGSTLAAFTLPTRMGANSVCSFQLRGRTMKNYDTFAHRGPECQYDNLEGHDTCAVTSCGGGLAFFSLPAVRNSGCNFTFVSENVCEWVPFHKCLADHSFGRLVQFKPWTVAMADSTGQRSDWSCTR